MKPADAVLAIMPAAPDGEGDPKSDHARPEHDERIFEPKRALLAVMADAHQLLAALDIGRTAGSVRTFGLAARKLEAHQVFAKWPALERPIASADAPTERKQERSCANDRPPEGLSHTRPPFSSERVLHIFLI